MFVLPSITFFWWFDMQGNLVVCPLRPAVDLTLPKHKSWRFMSKSCVLSLHGIVNVLHQIQGLLQLVYILWSEGLKELSSRSTYMRSPQPETFTSMYQKPKPLILTDMKPVVLEYIFYVHRQLAAYMIMKQVLPPVINSPHWFLFSFLVQDSVS